MSFAAPLALAGLAFVALPVLIHWLGRGRTRTIRFPSLRFLPPSQVPPAARARIEDPLLLALRVAVLALAAIALAQPVFGRADGGVTAPAPERVEAPVAATAGTPLVGTPKFDSLISQRPRDAVAARVAADLLRDSLVRGVWDDQVAHGEHDAAELDAAVALRAPIVARTVAAAPVPAASSEPEAPRGAAAPPFDGRWAWIAALVVLIVEGVVRRRPRAT